MEVIRKVEGFFNASIMVVQVIKIPHIMIVVQVMKIVHAMTVVQVRKTAHTINIIVLVIKTMQRMKVKKVMRRLF